MKSALEFLVAPTREWQPSPPEDEQNAICTKSCDIILMKIKVIRFAFKKPLVGHILNKIIVIWFVNPHHFLKTSKFVAGHMTKI